MSGPRPLRVVQIVTTLSRGGAQATVVASSTGVPAGVEVSILTGPDSTGEGSFWGDPALVGVSVEVVGDLVRSIRPSRDGRALRHLVDRLRSDRPDVVHTHSSKAGVLGRLAAATAGVPCVHTVHGWGPLDAGGRRAAPMVVGLERILARHTSALITVGQADLERGLALGIGKPGQYHLIRSGIDLPSPEAVDREGVRRRLGLEDRWVVGMVGRMAPQKDQAALVEAFARLDWPDRTLVLVGDGPTRAGVEALAARHPDLDIRFLGHRPDGARLVAGFDVAVNASRWEGLPRTVVEAAATGVPVVASDVGSTGELVRTGHSGRLVPPGDVAALIDALMLVREDPVSARAQAVEARRMAESFSAEQMRRDLVQLWHQVAGRPQDETADSGSVRATPPGRARRGRADGVVRPGVDGSGLRARR